MWGGLVQDMTQKGLYLKQRYLINGGHTYEADELQKIIIKKYQYLMPKRTGSGKSCRSYFCEMDKQKKIPPKPYRISMRSEILSNENSISMKWMNI